MLILPPINNVDVQAAFTEDIMSETPQDSLCKTFSGYVLATYTSKQAVLFEHQTTTYVAVALQSLQDGRKKQHKQERDKANHILYRHSKMHSTMAILPAYTIFKKSIIYFCNQLHTLALFY